MAGIIKKRFLPLLRETGEVRSFHVPTVKGTTLRPIMQEQIDRETALMTDNFGSYRGSSEDFASHDVIRHSQGEYVRGRIHTNTIEGYFSILKCGLRGVYQHVGAQHLKRYIGEFDFRYNHRKVSDEERAAIALKGIDGKRLTYTRTLSARA